MEMHLFDVKGSFRTDNLNDILLEDLWTTDCNYTVSEI